MFDTITSLFHAAPDLSQLALSVPPKWLPSPGKVAAAAGALGVAAVLVAVFLRDLRLSIEIAVGAVIAGFVATAAFGWQDMGRNEIIPKLNEANAQLKVDQDRADSFRADADEATKKLAAAVAAKRPIIIKQVQKTEETIHAQPEAVRSIVVPAAVGSVLNDAIHATAADANPAAAGAATSASGVNPGVSGVCSDTTVEAWEVWSTQVIGQYRQLASDYNDLHAYAEDLYRASVKSEVNGP